MLERVDTTPEAVVERKTSLQRYLDVRGRVRVRIERVWVFGSYARGALMCGDVDLVIQAHLSWDGPHTLQGKPHEGDAHLPQLRKVVNPLLGPRRGINFVDYKELMGRATVLDEVQVMRESILLWQPGMDWRAAVKSIQANPAAGRAPRPSTLAEAERIAEERDRARECRM
jgi:hypothetical protein